MKKVIFSLCLVLLGIINVNALCVSRTLYAYDDGKFFGKMILRNDCSFSISTVDGESFTGTYYIDSDEGLQSGATYTIVFNLSNGRTIRTSYMCPVYGKQCVNLDGFLFEAP